MNRFEFDSVESWSVVYCGVPYDNARKIDDVWYYRDPATRAILRFALQDCVMPLQRNTVTDAR